MKGFFPRAAFCCAVALTLVPLHARADQSYPNRGIRFVVPYAAGGAPDTTARIVAAGLQERLGQSVIVENRPGGAGSVGVGAVMNAPLDGYTFLVTDGSTVTTNPLLFKNRSYSARDLSPVALLARTPLFLAVNQTIIPVDTINEFISYVKARPGKVNYGSSGVGSPHHLSMESMMSSLHLKMMHVPYRGTGQSVPALLGGQVAVLFSALPSLSGGLQSKVIKLIANNGNTRSQQAPNVPPLSDIIPGYNLATMLGIFARSGTPNPIVQRIAAEVSAVVKMREVSQKFAANGMEAVGDGPDVFAKALSAETVRVTRVIKAAGIKVQ
jgi:tripartite-type tricarboxylate transporter receptor subunit TctC